LLAERGCVVHVMLLGDAAAIRGDAADALRRWHGEVRAIDAAEIQRSGAIIDALVGGGLKRPLTDSAAAAVEAINRAGSSGVPVLAVDLPSGIDGATGEVCGVAVKANETITFCRKKPGLLLIPGRAYAGDVRVADIGISGETVTRAGSGIFENVPGLWLASFPQPKLAGHKY